MKQALLAIRILTTYRNGYRFLLERMGAYKTKSDTTTYVTWNGMRYITRNDTNDFGILNKTTIFGHYLNSNWHKLKKDSLVLNFGAQAGAFSIYTAHNKKCQVICFEPEAENLKLLDRNIHRNGLSQRIKVIPKAVAENNKSRTFYTSPYGNKGVHSFFYKGPKPTIVECTTPLEILETLEGKRVDFLKIDIEGGEHEIIKPEFRKFYDQVDAIVIEYHCQKHMSEQHTLEELKDKLAELGFTTESQGTPELGFLTAVRK
jgi:FkbM family methyltransferase